MKDCIEFVDGYAYEKHGLQRILQDAHSQWFDIEDKTRPLWRLIIINHKHVLCSSSVTTSVLGWLDLFPTPLSTPKPHYPANFFKQQNAASLRSAAFASSRYHGNCLKQCRQHNTSFTVLFGTLVMVTLASNLYPAACISFSSIQIDMRRFLVSPPGNEMLSLSSSYLNRPWLSEYRIAGTFSNSSTPKPRKKKTSLIVKEYGKWRVSIRRALITCYSSGKYL